ncbi:MAG: response regulator [Clostridia bacterium]|nr:response regulator [Clostridia bacterium]
MQDNAGNLIGADVERIVREAEEKVRLAQERALEAEARLQLFIDSPSCGIAMLALKETGAEAIYFSDGYYRFSGYDSEAYAALMAENPFHLIYKEDRPQLYKALEATRRDGVPLNCTCRCYTRDGGCRWVNMRGTVTGRRDDAVIVNVVRFDITEQKMAEEALRVHEEELMLAMSQIGRMICEYDPNTHTLTMPEDYAKLYGVPNVLPEVPEVILRENVLDEASRADYEAFYEAILRGEKSGRLDCRVRYVDGTYHWEHTEFSSILAADGKPVKTILAIEDTTQQHLRFELEQSRPTMGEGNLLVHALFNLTTGETLDYAYRDGSVVPQEEKTAFAGGLDNLETLFIDEADRRAFRALNDPAFLQERFAAGETEHSIDYRRRMPSGDVIWVRNILHLVRDPGGSDVLLFEYCYNIEQEKIKELTFRSLTLENYDYVAQINGKTRSFVLYSRSANMPDILPESGDDVDTVAQKVAELNVHPDDREMTIRNTQLAGVRENLANRDRFQFSFRELQPDGSVHYKKLTQYYLDRERDIIVFTREDVSSIVEEEKRKSELLTEALEAANQASNAKSQFLSRMSHELRTPMNAIIGLSALAANDVNDPAAMADAIGKIGMSARYLLSLINDILEMSRIESGRMTLTEEPFDFEQFISGINTIIFGQANAKGVDYDAVVNSFMEPVYVGDATKLQQILINVLGNAVKFTPPGGKITFAMEQISCAKARATLRFVISDTGSGIDEKYLPHLFDAFSQESASFTSTSTGTGLGLAITKSLVEMMNGHIHVRSVKNVGSVFTIDVQLGASVESRQYLQLLSTLNLSKLKTLVVDDDVIVCQSTVRTLASMGMEAEWVDSGMRAVERVQQAREDKHDYDTIFIDWKMPDMDGVETTRQIRGIVGPDVTIIIITAYDYRMIEAAAIEAGADMFMEKPLFQSSIVKAFEKVFRVNAAKVEIKPAAPRDLAGKRILLAEDHPLNVEVAKRMLEKAGAEVVVVNNGLEALETFTTAPDDHFDLILMDIRMPVMDGLAATRNIRNLRKKGSRSVPIVAMTANAFDEDVELSLASGMDAHLAKPIEPEMLFATLQRLMAEQ